jgi:hypothetical protein
LGEVQQSSVVWKKTFLDVRLCEKKKALLNFSSVLVCGLAFYVLFCSSAKGKIALFGLNFPFIRDINLKMTIRCV